MANVGAVLAGAWGGSVDPRNLIPKLEDEEPDAETMKREEEIQASLRAADQRALLAALKSSTPKK